VGWRHGGMETRSIGRSAMRWRLLGASVAMHRADILMRALLPRCGVAWCGAVSRWSRCDTIENDMVGWGGLLSTTRHGRLVLAGLKIRQSTGLHFGGLWLGRDGIIVDIRGRWGYDFLCHQGQLGRTGRGHPQQPLPGGGLCCCSEQDACLSFTLTA
jgi:hypothetical protein